MVYFVVSDIHSFAKELKAALRKAGFNKRNKDHTLVVLGDVFDRGPDTVEVYRYLTSIPKRRLVLVKGNHEELYAELLKKDFPDDYDYSNHTVDTFCHIAGKDPDVMDARHWYRLGVQNVRDRMKREWLLIRDAVRESPVTTWIGGRQWRDYFELDRFVMVHSFIPCNNKDGLPGYYIHNRNLTELPGWREEATEADWSDARWGCPWKNYLMGLFNTDANNGKVLVCGHWVVTDFRENLDMDYSQDTGIYASSHLIGLDGGVWRDMCGRYVHPQNVMVVDGDSVRDQHGNELRLEDRAGRTED